MLEYSEKQHMIFEDRRTAAKALIPFLEKYSNDKGVVMAIPRGGVPVGYELSRHFRWPLQLVMTKKIGHPLNKEYAIGAVSLEGVLLNPVHSDVPASYIESETSRIRQQIRERLDALTGNHQPVDTNGKTVIIVDDGIATGFTILSSISLLKKAHPEKVIVAVPVAPPSVISKLEEAAHHVIVLETPEDFFGVGGFYNDFSEVTNEEVVRFMKAALI